MRPFCLLFVLVLVAGCEPVQPDLAGGPREIPLEEVEPPPDQASPTPEGITVQLLEAGAEPRSVLRYRLEPGHTERIRVTSSYLQRTGRKGAGRSADEDRTIALELEATVEGAAGVGTRRWSFRIVDASIERAGSARLSRADLELTVGELEGKGGFAITTDRGLPHTLSLRLPRMPDLTTQYLADALTRELHNLAVPLPLEPVGVGARWTVTDFVESRGVRTDRSSTFELTALEGARGQVTTTSTQSAEPQLFRLPRLPKEAEIGLDTWSGTGAGSAELDLGSLFGGPSRYEGEANYTFHATIPGLMHEDWVGSVKGGVVEVPEPAP